MSASMEARIAVHSCAPYTPLPVIFSLYPTITLTTSLLTDAGAPLGYRAVGILMRAADASPPLSLLPTSPRTDIPEAEMPPRKRAWPTPAIDTWDEIVEAMMEITPTTLEGVDQRVTELDTTVRQRTEEFEIRFEEAHDDRAYLGALHGLVLRRGVQHRKGTCLGHWRLQWLETPVPQDGPARRLGEQQLVMIIWRLLLALAERDEAGRRDGDKNYWSRWPDPMGQKKMESVFLNQQTVLLQCLVKLHLINIAPGARIKKAGILSTRLNSERYVLLTYNQRFYELASVLIECSSENQLTVERYIGGLPDMIHGSVKASKPQSMQEAIEFATEMMDKKVLTAAERQAENKRKFEDTSRNNQNQQQPFKRYNVGTGLTHAGLEIQKPYGRKPNLYVPSVIINMMGHCNCKLHQLQKRLVTSHVTTRFDLTANNNNNNNRGPKGTNSSYHLLCVPASGKRHYKSDCQSCRMERNQGNRTGGNGSACRNKELLSPMLGSARLTPTQCCHGFVPPKITVMLQYVWTLVPNRKFHILLH
ncbi:hypothetical protein Tco_0458185 [Tanacetum coccineum]